jgi:diguanylate cyclase (GGDEF)-like protein
MLEQDLGSSSSRINPGRRASDLGPEQAFWMPERPEIITQYFTRYVFFVLGVLFFSTLDEIRPILFSIEQILVLFGIYFLLNTWFFRLALHKLTLLQLRGAMAVDLLLVTVCVIHDPNVIPPSALAFLMVLLGNGMRYGMRLFAEVLGGALLFMAIAFALRYRLGGFEVGSGDVFFGVFWLTIALYAYILMGRIERQRSQLDYRSRYDALTGLLNRHGLLDAADRMLLGKLRKDEATILFADLNQFKMVNDRHGHVVGDRVLAEFAQIFRDATGDGLCGRWGGDEFVAILPSHDEPMVQQLFTRINARIESWSRTNGLPMAVSLGISHAPRDGHDLLTLLSVADISLYQSKSGKQDATCNITPLL